MKYDEVSDIIDGFNLVGYGRFNPDHITAVEQFKTMEKKWNTYRECINQILQLLLNGKSFVCLRDIYQIFLAHLRILKNLMKKNYLLKTKTYFFYIIYTFILILNRHHYYLIIIDTHRNVCSLEISSEDGNELKNIKFSFDKKFKENLKNNIEETIHVILNRIIEYNPIEDNEKVTYKLKQII